MEELMKKCLWCNLTKNLNEFSKNIKVKHCLKCHYDRYKNKERKNEKVVCPNCKKERLMRLDAYKIRKSDMCIKCSPLFNEQVFTSNHKLDTKHPLYKRWSYMKTRCIADDKKKWYKDRNITVCDEWKNNYKAFYEWSIDNGFNEDLELDRINNDLGYSPNNCQWITHKENCIKKVKYNK
jgi:hypothetical protein